MRNLVFLLSVMVGLLASTAGAQTSCVPGDRPIDPHYGQLVSRQGDRLRLLLDVDKSIELADCPYGDDGYHFLFERYDPAGRFYVVRKSGQDDFSYLLVMIPTGQQVTVYGVPVWTSEKSKFLTIACSLQPPRAALVIHAPDGAALTKEAEFELPCDSESCAARWDHQSWISVTCTPRDSGGKKGKEFVLMRSNNGTWSRFGR